MKRIIVLAALVLSLVTSACSGDISASSCDEVVDVTVDLIQRLIDDVDQEFGDMTVQEFLDTDGELPSIDRFTEDAARIDEIAAELGCSQSDISAGVDSRVDELTASTELGDFLIRAIRAGGL